jgi:N-acetylglucosaminyldiphosphoundecaprenol N-acetyl-beta-D-mannosaminyltransferase
MCVGAAFDFLAGTKPAAPRWMQRRGLAWVFRLYQEPRRLFKRYLVTNSIYVQKLTAQLIRQRIFRRPAPRGPTAGTDGPNP